MSLNSIFESTIVNIFNVMQTIISDEVIPKMINIFEENGASIDEDSLKQFFPNINEYSEISKYFSNNNITKKTINKIKAPTKKENIIKIDDVDEGCDYIFTKGKNKGNRCNANAINMIEGHSRYSKHLKSNTTKDIGYNNQDKVKKTINKITTNKSNKNKTNEKPNVDIKTLLAKIKASKEQELNSNPNKEEVPFDEY